VTLDDYATAYKLTRAQARAKLIDLALRHLEGRARSGAAYSVAIGPAERSARARNAVNARWARAKEARLRDDAREKSKARWEKWDKEMAWDKEDKS
jgi:hypothetical protein